MNYLDTFHSAYSDYKDTSLNGRYIHLEQIEPLLSFYKGLFQIEILGDSVDGKPIHGITLGKGSKRILMWSQMHGNESTTTKAIFDLLKYIKDNNDFRAYLMDHFTICIIPMLNPDGALAYTRVNSNAIDLNRDAQDRSQPESKILRNVFEYFKPDFCFNLHDQRTIFSVGKSPLPATISFLTPAEDKERSVTEQRKRSMEIIGVMNQFLQKHIPGQVGRYDDSYNINCIGDTFQSAQVPTILFESGHYQEDYEREQTRMYIACSIVCAIDYIGHSPIKGTHYKAYFQIPENDKLFYDVLLKNFPIRDEGGVELMDVAILFKESLRNGKLEFIPTVEGIQKDLKFYGHKEFDMNKIEMSAIEKYEINEVFLTKLLRKI